MTILPHQPDDPGISPANPYAPVVFKESQDQRQTAWLGAIFVGEVAPCHWGRMAMTQVRVLLPDSRPLLRADNVAAAKLLLAAEVREWIARTPLRFRKDEAEPSGA